MMGALKELTAWGHLKTLGQKLMVRHLRLHHIQQKSQGSAFTFAAPLPSQKLSRVGLPDKKSLLDFHF